MTVDELLSLSRTIAEKAGLRLLNSLDSNIKDYEFSSDLPKEVKSVADAVLEDEILQALRVTGLSVLSEESGLIAGSKKTSFSFIVDPLDGTFNFVRGLGPCAVSIALWEGSRPVFGVIYNLWSRELYWGGAGMGAFCNGHPIAVSQVSTTSQSTICTGFPVRLDVDSTASKDLFWQSIGGFGKVRMLGSAAVSLLMVAKGAAEVYSENHIMLWDVAAGLAIVEGAGGVTKVTELGDFALDVFASNGQIVDLQVVDN